MTFDFWLAAYGAAVLFVAYMVRGIAGFGSGLIAVPLLAFFFPVKVVVPLVVFLDYVGSLSQGVKNRELIAWREQLPLIPFTFVGVGVGLAVLEIVTAKTLAQSLGGFIIAYAVYSLLPLPELRGSRLLVVPFGFLGGFVGMLFGTGGPFYVIYFGLRALEKSVHRATFAMNFLIDGAIRLVGFAAFGFFDRDLLIAFLISLPIVGVALWTGGHIHAGLKRETYVRIIAVLLLGSGVVLLLKN